MATSPLFSNTLRAMYDKSIGYNKNNTTILGQMGARLVTLPVYVLLGGGSAVENATRLAFAAVGAIFYAAFQYRGQSNAFTRFYDSQVNPLNSQSALRGDLFGLVSIGLMIASVLQLGDFTVESSPSSNLLGGAATTERRGSPLTPAASVVIPSLSSEESRQAQLILTKNPIKVEERDIPAGQMPTSPIYVSAPVFAHLYASVTEPRQSPTEIYQIIQQAIAQNRQLTEYFRNDDNTYIQLAINHWEDTLFPDSFADTASGTSSLTARASPAMPVPTAAETEQIERILAQNPRLIISDEDLPSDTVLPPDTHVSAVVQAHVYSRVAGDSLESVYDVVQRALAQGEQFADYYQNQDGSYLALTPNSAQPAATPAQIKLHDITGQFLLGENCELTPYTMEATAASSARAVSAPGYKDNPCKYTVRSRFYHLLIEKADVPVTNDSFTVLVKDTRNGAIIYLTIEKTAKNPSKGT